MDVTELGTSSGGKFDAAPAEQQRTSFYETSLQEKYTFLLPEAEQAE